MTQKFARPAKTRTDQNAAWRFHVGQFCSEKLVLAAEIVLHELYQWIVGVVFIWLRDEDDFGAFLMLKLSSYIQFTR